MRVNIHAENVEAEFYEEEPTVRACYRVVAPGGCHYDIPSSWCTEIPPEIKRGTMVWCEEGRGDIRAVGRFHSYQSGVDSRGYQWSNVIMPNGQTIGWPHVRPVTEADLGGEG